MPIEHRFLNELENIEKNKLFCGETIQNQSKILIIGTFNPSNESCKGENLASWFYGRNRSKFWRYFPNALTETSLHPNDGQGNNPELWKKYCIENRIVIIDLIKKIDNNEILQNFSDREVENKIHEDLLNTEYFNASEAFKTIKFDRIIYSLKWSDNQIRKLKRIRDIINRELIECGSIQNINQIKYCKTPSRNDSQLSWNEGVNL